MRGENIGTERLDAKEVLPRLLRMLRRTTERQVHYNAARFPAGYHTWVFPVKGGAPQIYAGERDPIARLKALSQVVGYNFENKTVLDIGCNQGGMLVPIADQIVCGIGVDVNSELVNCANRMAMHFQKRNLAFYTYDLEEGMHVSLPKSEGETYFDHMLDFLPYREPDIIFLLAVCQWVKNWKELLHWCAKHAKCLFFEDNGNKMQQQQHRQVLAELYSQVIDLRFNERGRRLFFCSR